MLVLRVAPDDLGAVIGRGGRTARALRTVVRAGAVARRPPRGASRSRRLTVPRRAGARRHGRAAARRARARSGSRGPSTGGSSAPAETLAAWTASSAACTACSGERRAPDPAARGDRRPRRRPRPCAAHALELAAARAPEPEEDAFWVADLVGCEVLAAAARSAWCARCWSGRPTTCSWSRPPTAASCCCRSRATPCPAVDVAAPPARGCADDSARADRRAPCSSSTSSRSSRTGSRGSARSGRPERAGRPRCGCACSPTATTRRSHTARSTTRRTAAGPGMVMRVDVVAAAVEGAFGVPLERCARAADHRARSRRPPLRRRLRARARRRRPASRCCAAATRASTTRARARRHRVARRSARSCSRGGELAAMAVDRRGRAPAAGRAGRRALERGGVVLAGARRRARVPALHAAGRVPRLGRARGAAARGDHGADRRAGVAEQAADRVAADARRR